MAEKWKLLILGLPGNVTSFHIVPFIPKCIAGYSQASQKGIKEYNFEL